MLLSTVDGPIIIQKENVPFDLSINVASEALENFRVLEQSFENSGTLTEKIRILIGIATASSFRKGKVLAAFLEVASNSGIPESEINEAIIISALETSGAQLFWLKDVFDKVLSGNDKGPYYLSGGNDIGNLWVRFQQSVYEEPDLSRKDKELITVTQASFGRCPHCTKTHIAAARKHGCSAREITECLLFSATVAARCDLQWFKDIWRRKQLEYSWLSTITESRSSFWEMTSKALDYLTNALSLTISPIDRKMLMQNWLDVPVFPEVPAGLKRIKIRKTILKNADIAMAKKMVKNASLHSFLTSCSPRRKWGNSSLQKRFTAS